MALEFLKKVLSESDNSPSAIRTFSGWTVFWFVLALTFGFIWVVVYHYSLTVEFAFILAGLIAGVLGIKVWQKGVENKNEKSN